MRDFFYIMLSCARLRARVLNDVTIGYNCVVDSILDFVFETIFIVSNSKKIVFI